MKNILRRLHLNGSNQEDQSERGGILSKTGHRHSFSDTSSSPPSSSESRGSSSLSGWLNVAKHSLHQGGSPKHKKEDVRWKNRDEVPIESQNSSLALAPKAHKISDGASGMLSGVNRNEPGIAFKQAERAAFELASDQALLLQDEELQVQVALALSVRDDPEATAIETAKDLSLGSQSTPSSSTAEVLAYRYWKYNALNYDDKIVDGFYDVYGVAFDSSSETMPAFVDYQDSPVSDKITWDVVMVNRSTDIILVNLEQKVISAALDLEAAGIKKSGLAHKIAHMVARQMGGPVMDENFLHRRWKTTSTDLRASLGNVVLPLGRLQIGLGRHRALLFKVLADAVGIPCRLVKGKQYTGSDEGAVNIIKVDGRDYIIDLMGAPGTLLPSDVPGIPTSFCNLITDQGGLLPAVRATFGSKLQKDTSNLQESGPDADSDEVTAGLSANKVRPSLVVETKPAQWPSNKAFKSEFTEVHALPVRPSCVRTLSHLRSPSWTEGVSSPAVRDMKVKDVSQYMVDAAKENPKLAQKLHDVLVESGVKAPPDLFSDISPKQLQAQINQEGKVSDGRQAGKALNGVAVRKKEKSSIGPGRPPALLPFQLSSPDDGFKDWLNRLNSVEGLGDRRPLDPAFLNSFQSSSPSSSASSGAAVVQSSGPFLSAAAAVSLEENLPPKLFKRVPVAAAAAATAAVVASSMVVAAAKSAHVSEPTLQVPVAAAATATAAVVVATSAVVGRRLENLSPEPIKDDQLEKSGLGDTNQRQKEVETHAKDGGQDKKEGEGSVGADKCSELDIVSDKSTGSLIARSVKVLDDVAELEIPWEELVIGERIGLGSYGEVYHGDWHGTEVAVKKFLEQDISGDALEEFRSEVRLMRRMRHPNVVLFMGAVMRAPNLSIVTEFLPRGSLYRLIHRSNTQLDERRRMRMALDVARGMNYLHNCTPVIVHRDLKSPNLLVDKNWVVKVCDFGLSRMKHNTFLSSKSTAGTPEWMAPEVLRNEPSNEKCDVYSFGVILWELATLQQPWAAMNPMQVVGAVGFQQRTLDISDNMDPVLVKIIRQCWQSDPAARPSFAEIMAALKPLQKPITPVQSAKA